jgi:hypothetical protein
VDDCTESRGSAQARAVGVRSVAYAVVAPRPSAAYIQPTTAFDDIGSAATIAATRKSCRSGLSSVEHTPHAHEP